MYDYVLEELPALIEANFPVTDSRSIAGHSMGGHGAIMMALCLFSFQAVVTFAYMKTVN